METAVREAQAAMPRTVLAARAAMAVTAAARAATAETAVRVARRV